MNKLKPAVVALLCGVVGDVVFVLWPYLNVRRGAPSFTLWGGLFAGSVAVTFMGVAGLLFGKKAEDLFYVRDANSIDGKKAVGLIVLAIVSLAAYLAFEFYLEKLGYHLARR